MRPGSHQYVDCSKVLDREHVSAALFVVFAQ